jgi:two-component system, chemotaxis family, protein-glutamate methylesterase/glutaminase
VATPEEEELKHEAERERKVARVLVVDDSALMRRLLTDLLRSAPEIEVVGTARDGREAVLQATRLRPDVITLDVEMPEVSGLDALPLLLAIGGVAVVMVSSLTQEGAEVTLQALELGAFDFLPKPEKNQLTELRAGRDLLIGKVLAAAASSRRRSLKQRRLAATATAHVHQIENPVASKLKPAPASSTSSQVRRLPNPSGALCVVIGISTGGPEALSRILPELRVPAPPIIVVQHMPAQFTGVFAERLNRYSTLTVKQAEEGDAVIPDQVLIAHGGVHLVLKGTPPHVRVALCPDPPVSGHRPSIDVLFRSAAQVYERAVIGFLMTGMGRDGVDGCKAILAAGGVTLGQDEETSAVYGMNKAAYVEGAVKAQFALEELPGMINNIAALRASLEGNAPSEPKPAHEQPPQVGLDDD